MAFGIWTVIRGGVTGTREDWLKGADGERLVFENFPDALDEAAKRFNESKLKGGTTPSGRPVAYQYFYPTPLPGERTPQAAANAIIQLLLAMPWDERPDVIARVRSNDFFCCSCGQGSVEAPNPNCQCGNDE